MARPRLGDSQSKRLQMVITEAELDAIDVWQHANRIASRSEAIRRLVQIGLALDHEASEIQRQVANIEAANQRLKPFGEDLEGQPPPEQAQDLRSEIVFRSFALHTSLRSLFSRLDAFRTGQTVEDAEIAAAAASDRASRVYVSLLRGLPNSVRRSMGLEDT